MIVLKDRDKERAAFDFMSKATRGKILQKFEFKTLIKHEDKRGNPADLTDLKKSRVLLRLGYHLILCCLDTLNVSVVLKYRRSKINAWRTPHIIVVTRSMCI